MRDVPAGARSHDGGGVPATTDLDDVLRRGAVTSLLQPIVDLSTGAVVAHEALARGPLGPLHTPDALFGAAQRAGRVAELDALCREVAVRTAIDHGLAAPAAVFVNIEPSTLRANALDPLVHQVASAPRPLQVVLEITERELAARPAELLAAVARLRAAGWRIALDDVGAVDMSLTFLSLLAPDVVKIDMGTVQRRPDAATATLMNALNAYAERTGAVLLAEGVETEAHLRTALALGARLGQGWLFGRPNPHPAADRPAGALTLPPPVRTELPASPFRCLPAGVELRVSTKALLIEVSKHLERQAADIGISAMVLATFQQDHHFTPATRTRYRQLAGAVGFVGVFARDLASAPVEGVRGCDLPAGDPVVQEWDIVVLTPHFAAALLARDVTEGRPTADRDRRFEFALTYDRETVTAAARSLMGRMPDSH
ncbi:EAL domain-containing protein [Nakamurella deserti]|uniref:sensor domain-containing phosphodiesterase n=1 Tax=Nakamurella deserti TaxID=2164074 RepID=UPI000DBEA001|nr:EAL domain-containing protein [Nakamurella deserti]